MTEMEMDELDLLDRVFDGQYRIDERTMLRAEVLSSGGQPKFSGYALNEATITGGAAARIVDLELSDGDELIYTYRADGILVATPTGSTAYSLSAGGPITDNTMKLILVTPICAHTLSSRPLILPPDKKVTVELTRDREAASFLTVDGNDGEKLLKDDKVVVSASSHTTKLIRVNGMNFYEILRKKIGN
jgi:NAD+ kinase